MGVASPDLSASGAQMSKGSRGVLLHGWAKSDRPSSEWLGHLVGWARRYCQWAGGEPRSFSRSRPCTGKEGLRGLTAHSAGINQQISRERAVACSSPPGVEC